MKILIVNQPLGNRGDESAHKGLIRTLLSQIENVSIKVLFIDSHETYSIRQFEVNDERVNYIHLHPFLKYAKLGEVALRKPKRQFLWSIHPFTRQIKKQYEWSDVVMCAPGGICMGGFQDWKHLYFLKWAKYCKKPLAYFGRSFGPFPTETEMNRKFKEISYEMLHYFSYLSIRDKKTEKLADEIGIKYISTIDSAFLDNPRVTIPYEIRQAIGKNPYMVFVPNELLWHYAYEGKFTKKELVDFYCEIIRLVWKYNPSLRIVMLPQVFGKGEKYDDIHLFRQIGDEMQDERIVVTADCYNSDIEQTIIHDAEFVIGARYHSVVFAINQNVPFIALSYEHKIAGLMETLNMSENMIDLTNTMLTTKGRENCLKEVVRLLPILKRNPEAREQAKRIAQNGMNEFVKRFAK